MRVSSSAVDAVHSPEYAAALASPHWKKLIEIALVRSNATCEWCRNSPFDSMIPVHLSLHHLTYERLGKELETDVVLLCEPCHRRADRIREAKVRAARATRFYEARVNGWASKVYGENWYDGDSTSIYEEFDEWAQRKAEYGD